MLFAMITAAFDFWPESHPFVPRDPEHLRGWLLVEANYYGAIGNGYDPSRPDVVQLEDFVNQIIHQARLSGYGKLVYRDDGTFEFRFPLSIDWETLDQKEFGPLSQQVFDIITAETGLSLGDLRHERSTVSHD